MDQKICVDVGPTDKLVKFRWDVILTAMSSLSPSCRHSAQIGARFCGDGRADLRKLEHSFDRVTVNLIGD